MTTIIDPQLASRAATRKTLLGTGIGNAVEWYDWAIYATFTPFIASQLFSKADPASAVLATLAIFAVGFVARPVGGFLFGWIGDRIGRKTSMTLAVGLASLGSLMIGVAPSFATIGVWASLMLLVARLIQGLAHGGELPSSQTYLSEVAPKEKRGLWATLIYTSGTVGILAGTLLGAVLNMTLSTEAMNDWGWRVPFLVGAVMGLYALIMRSKLHETEAFEGETASEKRAADLAADREAPQAGPPGHRADGGPHGDLLHLGCCGPELRRHHPEDRPRGNPLGQRDRQHRVHCRPAVLGQAVRPDRPQEGALGRCGRSAVMHFPMTWLLKDSAWQLAVAMSVMLIFIAASAAIVPAVYAELFPTSIRTIGVGVPYSICVAVFGGTAPYLQTWLGTIGLANVFNVYAVVLLLVSALFVFTIPETKGKDLTH